jgi:hypothetical protein
VTEDSKMRGVKWSADTEGRWSFRVYDLYGDDVTNVFTWNLSGGQWTGEPQREVIVPLGSAATLFSAPSLLCVPESPFPNHVTT